jgi:hypothetical protein
LVEVLDQYERPVAPADTTAAAAMEVPDVLDGLEGKLGLACRICAGAGSLEVSDFALRSR